MHIDILGTESLGVRGLSCEVRTKHRHILIDPGVALGYQREGLLPHPVQVAAGEAIRQNIVNRLSRATDVVISHFHGDHMPLADANPYQLSLHAVTGLLKRPRLWLKNLDEETPHIAQRRDRLLSTLHRTITACEGEKHDILEFSGPMPHGFAHAPTGSVMMTRIRTESGIFVHGSDIQLLSDAPIQQILDWSATVVFLSGPPVYRRVPLDELTRARVRAKTLADHVQTVIMDHHLLRCREGIRWLDDLKTETRGRILCAADFMGARRRFLEARRAQLYARFPVPDGWHEAYAAGRATTSGFQNSI